MESDKKPRETKTREPKSREPWIIRTYAGFGDARQANQRFLSNLKQGQRGLSIAFDLPTQNGYDPDAPVARGEVGEAGVSICHWQDMETLFAGIPLESINTSMTINSTAPPSSKRFGASHSSSTAESSWCPRSARFARTSNYGASFASPNTESKTSPSAPDARCARSRSPSRSPK